MISIFLGVISCIVSLYGMVKGRFIMTSRRNILDKGKRTVKKFTGVKAFILNITFLSLGVILILTYFYDIPKIGIVIAIYVLIFTVVYFLLKPSEIRKK